MSFHHARVELNSAIVTVTDDQPPTLTSATGSLFGSTGYQHGTLTGTISGSDNSGVASARIYIDGNAVAESGFACDYTYAQPCPSTVTSGALSVDTTRLADGAHQLQAAVIDAAGNETRSAPQQLLVANHPPSAPVALSVTNAPAGWVNHGASVAWTNPPQGLSLPIAGVQWVTCRGDDATVPATGCGAVHSQTTPLTSLTEDPRSEPAFAASPPGTYTVFVWLVDSAGDSNPANLARAVFGFDDTAPGPPSSLNVTASSTGRSFAVRATAPAHVAPIASVSWVACKTGGKCTAPANAPGEAFDFDPGTNVTFRSAPTGHYSLRVWLEDAAGNTNPSAAASTTLSYPAGAAAKKTLGTASPGLHVTRVTAHGRELRVAGTASRSLDANLRVVDHYRVGRSAHLLRRSAKAADGRFSTLFVQPPGAQAERVTVEFAGDRHFRVETVTHKLAGS